MARYRYFKDAKNTITCVSSFAGKPVRGVAKCCPGDEFNEEKGKTLARIRCDIKIAKKRHASACDRLAEARVAAVKAQFDYDDALSYYYDSEHEQENLNKELEDCLANIYNKE